MQPLAIFVFFISTLTNPFSGIHLSSLQITPSVVRVPGYLKLIAVYEDDQQVVAYTSTNDELLIFDVTDPTSPIHIQTITLPGTINDIEIVDHYAYVASRGLRIFDLTDPTQPVEIGIWDEDGIDHIAITENYAYVSSYTTFRILDISDPTAPTLFGVFSPQYGEEAYETWAQFQIYDVTIEGDFVYLAGGDEWRDSGVRILDISDPTAIKQVGLYGTPQIATHLFLKSRGVDLWGKKLYLVTQRNQAGLHHNTGFTIHVIDVDKPALPTQIATYNPTTWVFDATIKEDKLYLVDEAVGLRIIDMADPYTLTEIGTYTPTGATLNVAVQGGYAYLVGEQGLEIVDISDPAVLEKLGDYQTLGIAKEVAATNEYAFVATGGRGLAVVDLSEDVPSEVKTFYELPGYTLDVAVQDNFAYVATELAGLRILDLTDPLDPVEVGVYDPAGEVRQVWVKEDLAFLVGDGGLDIVNVTNPAKPSRVSRYTPDGWVNSVKFYGEYVYVITQDSGLYILDLTTPTQPQTVGVHQFDSDTTSITDVAIISDDTVRYGYVQWRDCFEQQFPCASGTDVIDLSDLAQPLKIEISASQHRLDNPTLRGKDPSMAYFISKYLYWIDVQNPITPTLTELQTGYIPTHYNLTERGFVIPQKSDGFSIDSPDWLTALSTTPQRQRDVFYQLIPSHQITTSLKTISTPNDQFDFPISPLSPQEIVDLLEARRFGALDTIWRDLKLEPIQLIGYFDVKKFDIPPSLINGPDVVVEINQYDHSNYLFFKRDGNQWRLISYLPEIYSRFNESEYRFATYNEDIWLVINRHSGSGTGYSLFEENWYLLTENGFELKLTYSFSGYETTPMLSRTFDSQVINYDDQEQMVVEIEVDCSFSSYDDSNIDIFDVKRQGRYTWDSTTQAFFADPDQLQIPILEPFETACPVDYENFVETYAEQLIDITRHGNDEQKRWLKQYLMQTGLSDEDDDIVKVLLDSLQRFQ